MRVNGKLTKLLKIVVSIFVNVSLASSINAFASVGPANTSPKSLSDFSQDIQLITPIKAKTAKTITLSVNIKNTGSETWYSASNKEMQTTKNFNATNLVYLSAQWVKSDGHIADTNAFLIGHNLLANQSMKFKFQITAPKESGEYTLRLSMLQQGVAWFYQKGGNPLNVPVKVYS